MARTEKVKNWGRILTLQAALKQFGETYDPREAGFLLPDGRLIDFSERNEGGGGIRSLDHRAVITDSNEEVRGVRTKLMFWFCAKNGAIRINQSGATLFLDVFGKITSEQARTLRDSDAYSFGEFFFQVMVYDKKNEEFERALEFKTEDIDRAVARINTSFVDDKARGNKKEEFEYILDSGYSEDEANEIADDLNRQHPETEHEVGREEKDGTFYVYEMRTR